MSADRGDVSWVRRPTVLIPSLLVGLGSLAYLTWMLRLELIIAFGAVLFGMALYRLAVWLADRTGLPHRVCTGIWFVASLALVALFFVFVGQQLSEQYGEFGNRFPQALQAVEEQIEGMPLIGSLAGQIEEIRNELTGSGESESEGSAEGGQGSSGSSGQEDGSDSEGTTLIQLTFRALSMVIVGAIIALFVAADGRAYSKALLRLFPPERRHVGEDLFRALGIALPWWLVGRFAAMGVVTLLTAPGLMLLGIPLALVLAVIAGIFSFVPLIGPAAAVIPAVVITMEADPSKVLWVLALYGAVQLVESNLISPWIQKKVASVPPLLLITAQLLMGALVGLVGVMFSTPFALAVMVTIQVVYIRHTLDEDVTTPKEEAA